MDFKPYLPHVNESVSAYTHRLWISDLWDKIPFDMCVFPNETIKNLQRLKWYVWSRDRKQLAETMNKVEVEMRQVACNTRYEWLKVYARRLYKRKNMIGAKTYQPKLKPKSRSISPVGFVPSSLRKD